MSTAPDTKERIKQSALHLFVEQGIGETSIRDIAQRAGISQGAMYNHYSGKDELVWDLFASNFSQIGGSLRSLADEEKAVEAKLRAMIGHIFGLFDQDWALVSYVFFTRNEMLRKASCSDLMYPYMVFHSVITEAVQRRELPKQNPDLSASLVIGAMLQVADTKALGRLQGPLTSFTGDVVRSCMSMLKQVA